MPIRPLHRLRAVAVVAAGLLAGSILLTGCTPDANRARLEADIATSFPNAWELADRLQGKPVSVFDVDSLECHSKVAPDTDTGPGAWSCQVSYTVDGKAVTRELGASVDTFGCYSAFDADHRDRTIVDVATGATVPDPRVGFDGCFDVRSETAAVG